MFDWNEEELADIIWGEASENGDHVVPYPKENEQKLLVSRGDQTKKQWDQDANTVKPAEQKTPAPKNDSPNRRLEGSSQFNTNEGFSAQGFDLDSWPDLPLSIAECDKGFGDRNDQDSISEISNFNSVKADAAQLDSERELFVDEHVDKEGGFLDYSWANIGSFDDLDRIFRNDDSIFGHESLGNADELWSSTDVISNPAKSFPLSAGSPSSGLGALKCTSEQYEVEMAFVPHKDQSSTPGNGKMNDHDYHGLHNLHPSKDEVTGKQSCSSIDSVVECAGGRSKPLLKEKNAPEEIGKTESLKSQPPSESSAIQNGSADKGSKQRKLLSQIKAEEKSEEKLSQELCSAWSPTANQFQQFGNQFATSTAQTFPSSVLSPQRQIGGHDSMRYLQTAHSYFPAGYENQVPYYPFMPPLQHIQPERDKHHQVQVGHEFSPRSSKHANASKKSPHVSTNSLIMSPQEKIEKLRRRQQIQAMLAIQKQQQQFSHQATCTDQSITQKCQQAVQSEDKVATNIEVEENLKMPPSLDPTSPVEQDDSNTVSMVINESSLEETILDHLQEVIGKLDIRIRLCIRDSLYRLAQSAMLRHNAPEASSTNKSSGDENEAATKEESKNPNRSITMSRLDAETETNPIDRTVAHLLFYRPPESSAIPIHDGEIPRPPIPNKLSCEARIEGLVNLPMECLSENSTEKQSVSNPGTKTPSTFPEPQHEDKFRGSPYINTPVDTSNNEPGYGGVMEVEASQ
ncbi:protein LNK2-like isoform X2 [Telopea speciosissima]|uniref:protein LNK2-like isoform X2 n=1 Tax=Telopea speciosissima TaxID=54955 RepID=UPI001CC6B081|nr:protein LNK2-like isoform X2 [Telopea speciosissima]